MVCVCVCASKRRMSEMQNKSPRSFDRNRLIFPRWIASAAKITIVAIHGDLHDVGNCARLKADPFDLPNIIFFALTKKLT